MLIVNGWVVLGAIIDLLGAEDRYLHSTYTRTFSRQTCPMIAFAAADGASESRVISSSLGASESRVISSRSSGAVPISWRLCDPSECRSDVRHARRFRCDVDPYVRLSNSCAHSLPQACNKAHSLRRWYCVDMYRTPAKRSDYWTLFWLFCCDVC
jgi:hypothetical protein